MTMKKKFKIFVAGHNGMVGSAIVENLRRSDYANIITRNRHELDLIDQAATFQFLNSQKPDYIFLAAAKVGGINANNQFRADFILDNLIIQNNVIYGALRAGVQNLCFLGSSCIYPRDCPQPMKESYLFKGELEETNRPYAVAKLAGLEVCASCNYQYGTKFVALMPTNLYGPKDNYNLETSHVLPALIRKAHESKVSGYETFSVWGTGTPKREFLHVDDLAKACIFVMENDIHDGIYNVGSGEEVSIIQLAEMISAIVGFSGGISLDSSKPDGAPRKLLDTSKLTALGWQSRISLAEGIENTYQNYLSIDQ